MSWRTLYLFVFSCSTIFYNQLFAQCTVTATVNTDIVTCGNCAQLTAFGRGQGQLVFQENFNSGAPSGWAFTQQARFDNPCSPNGVNGTPHLWMGNTSAVPRVLETQTYNFSSATSGVTVCFDMLFASQGGSAPCEGPDEPQEGVYLQYRIGGGQWVTVHYFDPNGGYDPQLINWNNWCFPLPAAAVTNGVSIRFYQDFDSGADYDHWGVDNVVIYYNDPSYYVRWVHDNYTYPGNGTGGPNPNPICPHITTDYVVMMTNNISYCYDTVRVTVETPSIVVDAGADTTICLGDCGNLNATAKVIHSPGGPKSFFTTEPDTLTSVVGIPVESNINVRRLNMTNVRPNSILSVCIDSADVYDRIPFFSNFFWDQFQFDLVCPSNVVIRLVSVSTLDHSKVGIEGMCFVPAGGAAISTGNPPYTGSFSSVGPFANLYNGCAANGVWKLRISAPGSLAAEAIIRGWSITFNDIEINYPANFTWTPTTAMTNSNTLTPNVCPTADQQYIITGTDTAGCVTARDTVQVTVQPVCCMLAFTASSTQPTCGASDGTISLNITAGSGNYTYLWNDSVTTQNRTGVPAGSYSVTVTDLTYNNCDSVATINLSSANGPVITNISAVDEVCLGDSNGTATVAASGGTAPLSYLWSNNETTTTISGLPGGTYTVTVTDVALCQTSGSIVVQPGPLCCFLTATATTVDASCSAADGSLTIHPTLGTAPYSFSIDGVSYVSDSVFSGLAGGVYNAIARDINLCADTVVVTIVAPPNTITATLSSTDVTCFGGNDGQAVVAPSGGNAPLGIVWSTTSTNDTLTALAPGTYHVTITDQINCTYEDSATVGEPAELPVGLGPDLSICADSTATFTLVGTYTTTAWSTGDSGVNSISLTQPGTVSVTVTDANGCVASDTAEVLLNNAPVVDTRGDTTIYNFESITLNTEVSGTLNPAGFVWTPSTWLSCEDCQNPIASPDSSIIYYLTYYDLNSCPAYDTVTLTVLDGEFFAIVPNAFTPNGDGPNDLLHVYHKGLERLVFRVYNRWGSIVFQTKDPNEGWDGTHKGKQLAPDVFIYELYAEFIFGPAQRTTGSVTLIR